MRRTHQGANPGLYPQLCAERECLRIATGDAPGKARKAIPITASQKTCQTIGNPLLGRVSPRRIHMRPQDPQANGRIEFNLTTASTLDHLIVVSLACVGLWAVIIATFSV